MVNAYNKAMEEEQKNEKKQQEQNGGGYSVPSMSSLMSQGNSMMKSAMGHVPKF